jgi:hypothetical protein
MEHPGEAHDALYEAVVFLGHFNDLPDPRQSGKVTCPLDEVLLLCLLAVLAGAETITDIARFGEKKRDLLRRFRPFADGTPAHDHLGDILATLDAEAFQRCFVTWVASITGIAAEVIAIATRAACTRTSNCSWPSKPPTASRIPRSAATGRSMLITGALGHGHDLPRRRVQGQNRQRSGELRHHPAHGP